MKRILLIVGSYFVLLATVATLQTIAGAQQTPADVPTWQEAVDQPWRAAEYPAWKPGPDELAPLTDEDIDKMDSDEDFRAAVRRLVAEQRRLRAELEELKGKAH